MAHQHELQNLDKIIEMLKQHREGMAAYGDEEMVDNSSHMNEKDSEDMSNGYRKHY